MNLTCKINGVEYPIVQGNTFADEYNETLDSGSVIIAHVKKIKKLKPFDDVFVYDSNFKFGGYSYGTDTLKSGDVVDTNGNKKLDNIFFKHLLVDNYTEEFINLKDKTYKYKISLMSETKGLEKVQCPNISVTQPLNPDKKVSIYTYLQRFVSMYSPKFKKVMNDRTKTWVYAPKYKVDESLEKIFGNVYPPDFSLNAPTLRDILSKLMVCKDMIPYVENGVIKAMDITQRKNEFSLDDIPTTNIVGSMSSNDYCDALRRNYSEGLSQNSTCRSVEYLGFRNSDSALMTLENMRLETRFPIYKINKMYMCYYKKANLYNKLTKDTYSFLCKQDITPLVKLNTERNVLSKDWDDFETLTPYNMQDLAQYKLATIGYDIGSNHITGWGESYSYPKGWWRTDKRTYLENILRVVDSISESGVYKADKLFSNIPNEKENIVSVDYGDIFDRIITPFNESTITQVNSALDMKGLFFIIDYQGFFNGSVVVSKDDGFDNIVANDNSSSSLALLEYDGLSQKEKVNRLGNKTYQFTVRYDNYGNDLSFLQNVGDYFKHDDEEDIIIYHREYSIYDTYVIATYFAAKDYVLKNYYTSVYARHRTWNLMSYGESVHRAENRKTYLLLSKDRCFYEVSDSLNFSEEILNKNLLLSCFVENANIDTIISLDNFEEKDKINYGYISHENNFYLTDVNSFCGGYSLCFNLKMVDNISMGSYISNPSPFYGKEYDGKKWEEHDRNWFNTQNDYTGSKISLYKIVDDDETGFTKTLGFYVGHNDSIYQLQENLKIFNDKQIESYLNIYKNYLLVLPKINESDLANTNNLIGLDLDVYKDNKEYIDMTYQIEPITNDKNVLFSQWFMFLNDMLSNFNKTNKQFDYVYSYQDGFYDSDNSINIQIYQATISGSKSSITAFPIRYYLPRIVISMDKTSYDSMLYYYKEGEKFKFPIEYANGDYLFKFDSMMGSAELVVINNEKYNIVDSLRLQPLEIYSIDEETETITVKCYQDSRVKRIGETDYAQVGAFQLIQFKRWNVDENNKNTLYFEFEFPINSVPILDTQPGTNEVYVYQMFNAENTTDAMCISNDYIIDVEATWPESDKNRIDDFSNYAISQVPIYWKAKKLQKTYFKNMFVVTSREPLRNTLVYDEYKQANFPDSLNVRKDISVADVFKVGEDEYGSFIEIDITQFRYDDIKSIQYWYKDIINNDPDNSLMKFVFGVNLTDEDLRHHTVKVYASLVSNRDTRVYDQNHNVVGEVVNYLDENNEKPYGQNQYYMVK